MLENNETHSAIWCMYSKLKFSKIFINTYFNDEPNELVGN